MGPEIELSRGKKMREFNGSGPDLTPHGMLPALFSAEGSQNFIIVFWLIFTSN